MRDGRLIRSGSAAMAAPPCTTAPRASTAAATVKTPPRILFIPYPQISPHTQARLDLTVPEPTPERGCPGELPSRGGGSAPGASGGVPAHHVEHDVGGAGVVVHRHLPVGADLG